MKWRVELSLFVFLSSYFYSFSWMISTALPACASFTAAAVVDVAINIINNNNNVVCSFIAHLGADDDGSGSFYFFLPSFFFTHSVLCSGGFSPLLLLPFFTVQERNCVFFFFMWWWDYEAVKYKNGAENGEGKSRALYVHIGAII